MIKARPWLAAAAVASLTLLYLPLLGMVIASLNAARWGLRWEGFTLQWYAAVWREPTMLEALRNTLVLAVLSTAVSTLLGTMLALGLVQSPWSKRFRSGTELLLEIPVMLPDILFAVGLLLAFRVLCELSSAFELGLGTLVLSHVTFQISFVALVVRARLVSLGPTLYEAARDLYAEDRFVFRRLTLPLMLPALVAGALLAFTLSLDDAVISYFVRGTTRTVPTLILTEVKKGVSPQLHALSTTFFAITVALVLALERGFRKQNREKG